MVSPRRYVRQLRAGLGAVATAAVLMFTLGFVPQLVSVGSDSDPFLTVRARGATGLEQMEVRVGGEVLSGVTVGTEWADYRVDTGSAAGAADVQVAFVNDALSPDDQNLWVDHVRYGGQTYESEAETTFGTGVWQNDGRCQPGYHRSELLACDGYLGFGDLAGVRGTLVDMVETPSPAGGSTIVVGATGATGHELIEVRVGGEAVATFETNASADIDRAPDLQPHRHDHGATVTPGDVEVAFVNDRYADGIDHNVRIGWVEIDGIRYDIDRWSLDLTSDRHADVCRKSWDVNWVIACNGSLRLTEPSATQQPVTAAPAATIEPEPVVVPSPPAEPVAAPPPPPAPTPEPEPVADAVPQQEVDEPLVEHPAVIVPEYAPPTPPDNSGPVAQDPRGAGIGNFYVVGSDIVGPDGKIFYPIGANVAIKFTPYGYVFEGNNGGVGEHLGDVKAWNWNTIRATLICDNDSGVPSFDELVDGIEPTIERFTAAGIVVMLECHDSTGKDPKLGSAKDLAIRRFWDEMASRYKDNPYVWFNIYNEPYRSDDGANWARLHQFYIDRIRATGAENIIVADVPIWGQGIHLLAQQSFADQINRECNTVFGWHAYGAIDGQQGSLADHERYIQRVQDKGMAVVIGEYGVASPQDWGNAGPWQWNISGFEALTRLGPKYGIGLLWWHATGDQAYFSLYALKNDRSGFWTAGNSGNLTPYGQKFWDVSQRVSHDLGTFTGDLADSGCRSAGA